MFSPFRATSISARVVLLAVSTLAISAPITRAESGDGEMGDREIRDREIRARDIRARDIRHRRRTAHLVPASSTDARLGRGRDSHEPVTWNRVDRGIGEAGATSQRPEPEPLPATVETVSHTAIMSSPVIEGLPLACDAMGCEDDVFCEATPGCSPVSQRWWGRAEYLLWSLDSMELPPLVTTSPAGTATDAIGVLGEPGTSILFGGDTVSDSFRSGGRITVGRWANSSRSLGYQLSYFGIASDGEDFASSGGSDGILARPVFNTTLAAEASMVVADPDFLDGTVSVKTRNDLQAIDLIQRKCLWRNSRDRWDWLIGYRYARLDESLRIDQFSINTAPQGPIITGTTVDLFDSFDVENRFHGGQFGLQYQRRSGGWTLDWMTKVGIGVNRAEVTIDGNTTTTVPGGGTSSFSGGLLAQDTNIGSEEDDDLSFLPETRVTLSAQLDPRIRVSIGYGVLYWSSLARVEDHIDVQVSQFPPEAPTGTQSPQFRFTTDDLIAHGAHVGLTYRY